MINLHEGEEILAKHHKHWFVLVSDTLPLLVLFAIPYLLIFFTKQTIQRIQEGTMQLPISDTIYNMIFDPNVLIFAGAGWFLLMWVRFFMIWTDYYLDVWIATNKRIIDIDQKGLFNREVSECRYEQVQDVTVEIHGIIATMLNFGEIHVQTAGEKREIIIKGVARPNKLRDFISQEHDHISTKRRFDWQERDLVRARARKL
jgi:hypothetical protein